MLKRWEDYFEELMNEENERQRWGKLGKCRGAGGRKDVWKVMISEQQYGFMARKSTTDVCCEWSFGWEPQCNRWMEFQWRHPRVFRLSASCFQNNGCNKERQKSHAHWLMAYEPMSVQFHAHWLILGVKLQANLLSSSVLKHGQSL